MNQYVRDVPYKALALDVSEAGSGHPQADRSGSRTPASSGWSWSCPVPARSSGPAPSRASTPSTRRPTSRACTSSAWRASTRRLIRDYVRERRERWLRLFTPAPDLRQPLRLPLFVAARPQFFKVLGRPSTLAMVRARGPVFCAAIAATRPGQEAPAGAIFLLCGVWRSSRPCSFLLRRGARPRGLGGPPDGFERAARTRRAGAARTPRRRRRRAAAGQAGRARRPGATARAVPRSRRARARERRPRRVRAARGLRAAAGRAG